jgi:hypothetical protein
MFRRRYYGGGARRGSFVLFIMFIFFGVYLLNIQFVFFKLPQFINDFNNWIFVVCGVLLIMGGINSLRVSRYPRY